MAGRRMQLRVAASAASGLAALVLALASSSRAHPTPDDGGGGPRSVSGRPRDALHAEGGGPAGRGASTGGSTRRRSASRSVPYGLRGIMCRGEH